MIGLARRFLTNPMHVQLAASKSVGGVFNNLPLFQEYRAETPTNGSIQDLNQTTGQQGSGATNDNPTATDYGSQLFTTTAAASQLTGISQNASGIPMWAFQQYGCRFKAVTTTGVRYWIGIIGFTSPLTFALLGADNPSIAHTTTQWIMFRYSTAAGDTTWQCGIAGASGGAKFFGTNVALDTTRSHYFQIIQGVSGGLGVSNYLIDGKQVGQLHANGNFNASQFMPQVCTVDNTTTALSVSTRFVFMWAMAG